MMGEESELVYKAASALSHVVGAFTSFRDVNSDLNQLLLSVERILKAATSSSSVVSFGNLDDSTTLSDLPIEEFHCRCCSQNCVVTKRKRLEDHFSFEGDGNGDGEVGEMSIASTHSIPFKRSKVDDGPGPGSATDFTDDGNDKFQAEFSPTAGEEVSPEEQVFTTDLIVEQILRYAGKKELMTCRLINSFLNSISTKLLLKADGGIPFKLDEETNSFKIWNFQGSHSQSQKGNKCLKETDLKDLIALLKKRNNFPCSHFAFFGGPLNHDDLQQFFTLYGGRIRNIYVEIEGYRKEGQALPPPTVKDLKKLLEVQAPNIELLRIQEYPKLWKKETFLCQLFPEPTAQLSRQRQRQPLHKLKYFNISRGIPISILEQILQAATNLTHVFWDTSDLKENPQYFQSLLKLNKLHLIKEITMRLDPEVPNNSKMYEKYAESCSPLQKLIVVDFCIDYTQVFRTLANVIPIIFKRSADSLRSLKMYPLGFIPDFKIPVMSQLEKITLSKPEDSVQWNTDNTFFPPGLVFSKTFPALKCIRSKLQFEPSNGDGTVSYSYPWEETFNISNPANDILLTLEELEFSVGPPMPWLQNFTLMFPNVTTLIMGDVSDLMEAMQIFCDFAHLKTLEFDIDVTKEGNKYPAIDAAFTGFSKDTCLQLYKTSKNVDVGSLEKLREHKSILNFKKLKHLQLTFSDWSDDVRGGESYVPILSHVSGIFAFQMCPQLQVTVKLSGVLIDDLDYDKMWIRMSPIFPYVSSISDGNRYSTNNDCI